MKTTAVICECNPVHAGHIYLFEQAKAAGDCVIAVMSGSFTQRGEAAVSDKYSRAEALLHYGADAVVELPFPWSISGAEDFARGGVAVAAGLGADSLTFGSSSADIGMLSRAADIKDSPGYADAVREAEKSCRSAGTAVLFDRVMAQYGITDPLGANDKLGMEYIRAGRKLGITDFRAVQRKNGLKSASDLREMIARNGVWPDEIPETAAGIYGRNAPCQPEDLYAVLFTYARFGIPADEENDILRYAYKAARSARTPAEFAAALPTKKYTAARVRRELLLSLFRVKASRAEELPGFTVLLAAGDRGRAWLADHRGKTQIPVITKPADYRLLDGEALLQAGILHRADELYAFLTERPADWFVRQHPAMT